MERLNAADTYATRNLNGWPFFGGSRTALNVAFWVVSAARTPKLRPAIGQSGRTAFAPEADILGPR